MRAAIVSLLLSSVALASSFSSSGGGSFTGGTVTTTVASTVASGSTSFSLLNGAKLDLGDGSYDYLKSDGASVIFGDGLNSTVVFGRAYDLDAALRLDIRKLESTTIRANMTDGAAVVGTIIDNGQALANATAKLLSVRDNGSEALAVGVGARTLYLGRTATTNGILSLTSAATLSSSVASFTLSPATGITPDANDLLFDVKATLGGTTVFSVDKEGDTTVGGSLVPSSDLTTNLGSASLSWLGMDIRNIYDEDDNLRANFQSSNKTTIYGQQANGSSAVGVVLRSNSAYSTAGAKVVSFGNATTEKAAVDLNGFYLQPAQTVTVANDGAGSAPATNVTPSSNLILIAYNDVTNGSVGTLSETGAQEGSMITMVHTGSGGTVVFTESAGVQEIGATACTLGLSDTATAVYANSSWHFLTCRDN